MQTLSQSTPKARKAHRCEMCRRVIDAGETYTRQANLGDDGFYAWINCQQCDVFLNLIEDWDGYGVGADTVEEWEPGNLWELRLKALWHMKWRRADGTLHPFPVKADLSGLDEFTRAATS